jgi:hypothetical protein
VWGIGEVCEATRELEEGFEGTEKLGESKVSSQWVIKEGMEGDILSLWLEK